jgi:hypothetical protein
MGKSIHMPTYTILGVEIKKQIVKMGSVAMMDIPSFVKTDLAIQKLVRGVREDLKTA